MQTILGAGGSIGVELARNLTDYTREIRLVNRNPKKVNETDQLHAADLTRREAIFEAVAGSSIVYVTVGFPYDKKVWKVLWVPFIRNVIDACSSHGCKLVFFDNIYALDPTGIPHITENVPMHPVSEKGKVRAEVDRLILEAVENGRIEAIIARSPDFFGPIKNTSVLMTLVYDNYAKNKPAQWFCNADLPHSFGYTPELAKGTAMLGNAPDAFNQIWNLPVDSETLTGRQWASLFAREMNKKDKIQVLPGWGIRLLGLFIPVVGEFYEMRYQYSQPYFFDSSKFNQRFNYKPIDNLTAVRRTLEELASH